MNQNHSQEAYEFYHKIGSPKYVCAPMVDQSELAFRMLTRSHGTQLAYSPMLHSRIILESKTYKDEIFTTCKEDRPLIVQFCGNDPETMVKAAKMVENECDAVDINLGCPQGIAKKGNYGSFLLEKPEIILDMVKALKKNIKVPITCKIRILKDKAKTLELAQSLQEAGCSILCVHGRLKEQNKDSVGMCNWDIIREIKELLTIPVFANGGIYDWSDVERCLRETKVEAVMSSEALLENPALFSGNIMDLDELAMQYMELAQKYGTRHGEIKGHLFKLLHTGLSVHVDLRSKLANARSHAQHLEVVIEMKERRKDIKKEDKFGWYHRYQKYNLKNNKEQIAKQEIINAQINQVDEQVEQPKQQVERIEVPVEVPVEPEQSNGEI